MEITFQTRSQQTLCVSLSTRLPATQEPAITAYMHPSLLKESMGHTSESLTHFSCPSCLFRNLCTI